MYDVRRMPRVAGQTLRGGGFAVPEDVLEDRWISPLEETNALVDIAALPGVLYPYLPQLGRLVIKPGQRPVVSKRDARNYYPTLRAGAEWWQWFPHPPLRRDGGGCVPVHTTWPMGFRGSCVIAQSVTDVVCEAANLPQDRKLRPGVRCRLELPVWGSILDDIWIIFDEHSQGPAAQSDGPAALTTSGFRLACRPIPRSSSTARPTRRSKAAASMRKMARSAFQLARERT